MTAFKRLIDQIVVTKTENKRCNLYEDLKKQILNPGSKNLQLNQETTLKFIGLIKEDTVSKNGNIKNNALIILKDFLNSDAANKNIEVLIDCLLSENSNQDVHNVVYAVMKNRLTVMIQNATFGNNILENEQQFPLVRTVLTEIVKELPKDVSVTFLVTKIMPLMYESSINALLRTKAVGIGTQLVNFVNLTDLPPSQQDAVFVSIEESYVRNIGELRETNDANWYKLWMFLVKFCHKKLHNRQPLNNHLLRVVEVAFRNSTSVEQRLHAYDCWNELIDNKSLNMDYMCTRKQITLLITPLKAKFSRTPVVIWKRFDTFVYLLEKLGDSATLCLKEFLEFCYGPFDENGNVKKMGQSNIVRDLQLLRTKVFMAMMGHCHGDENCIEAVQRPIINVSNFSNFAPILVSSVMECFLAVADYKGEIHKVSVIRCLWRSLLQFINQTDNKTKNCCCIQINNIMKSALEKIESDNYRTVLSAIIEVLISDDIVDNLIETVFNITLDLLCRTSTDEWLFDPVKAEDFITVCLNLKNHSTTLMKTVSIYYNNDKQWNNVKLLCYLWLKYNFLLSSNNYSSLIWPLRHLDKFEDPNVVKLKWSKVYGEQCNSESTKLAVLQEIEKLFLENPLLSSGITAALEVISNSTNQSLNFVVNFLKLTETILTYPNLKDADLKTIISIISNHCDQNFTFYQLDNRDVVAKLCACIKHIVVVRKNFSILPKLQKFFATLPKKTLLEFSAHVLPFLEDVLLNEDPSVLTDVRKLIGLLDVKQNEPEMAKLSTPRSLRMINMTGTPKPDKPINQMPSLRIFGKNIETSSPPVKGSQLKKKSMDRTRSNRSRKILAQTCNKTLQSIDDGESSDYVKIDTVVKLEPANLSEHQKEVLKKRREDIPALYQDLSQSETRDFSSNSSQDFSKIVQTPENTTVEQKIESTSSKTNIDMYSFNDNEAQSDQIKFATKAKSPKKADDFNNLLLTDKSTKDLMELFKPKLITRRHLQVEPGDEVSESNDDVSEEMVVDSSKDAPEIFKITRSRKKSQCNDENNESVVQNNNSFEESRVEFINNKKLVEEKSVENSAQKTSIDPAISNTTSNLTDSFTPLNDSSMTCSDNSLVESIKSKVSKKTGIATTRPVLMSKIKRRKDKQLLSGLHETSIEKYLIDDEVQDNLPLALRKKSMELQDNVKKSGHQEPNSGSIGDNSEDKVSLKKKSTVEKQHDRDLLTQERYKAKLRKEILEARKKGNVVTRSPKLVKAILKQIENEEKNENNCERGESSVTVVRDDNVAEEGVNKLNETKSSEEVAEAIPPLPVISKAPRKQCLKKFSDKNCLIEVEAIVSGPESDEIDKESSAITSDDRKLRVKSIEETSLDVVEPKIEVTPINRTSRRRRSKSIDGTSLNTEDVTPAKRSLRKKLSKSSIAKSDDTEVEGLNVSAVEPTELRVAEKLEAVAPSDRKSRKQGRKSADKSGNDEIAEEEANGSAEKLKRKDNSRKRCSDDASFNEIMPIDRITRKRRSKSVEYGESKLSEPPKSVKIGGSPAVLVVPDLVPTSSPDLQKQIISESNDVKKIDNIEESSKLNETKVATEKRVQRKRKAKIVVESKNSTTGSREITSQSEVCSIEKKDSFPTINTGSSEEFAEKRDVSEVVIKPKVGRLRKSKDDHVSDFEKSINDSMEALPGSLDVDVVKDDTLDESSTSSDIKSSKIEGVTSEESQIKDKRCKRKCAEFVDAISKNDSSEISSKTPKQKTGGDSVEENQSSLTGSVSPEAITVLIEGPSPKKTVQNGANEKNGSSTVVALTFNSVNSDDVNMNVVKETIILNTSTPKPVKVSPKRKTPDERLLDANIEVYGNVVETEDVIASSQNTSPRMSPRLRTRNISPAVQKPSNSTIKTKPEVAKPKVNPAINCYIDLSLETKTSSINNSLTDTETCNSEFISLTPQIQMELPKKPDLTDSEREMCDMSTETLRSDYLSPKERIENLAGSPVHCETPDRTAEFLNNTLDISPINSKSFEETTKEITLIPGARGSKLLRMANPDSVVINNGKPDAEKGFLSINWLKRNERINKRKKRKEENLQVLTFSREIPSPLTRPGSSILKRNLSTSEDSNSPNPKRKRVNFCDPAISDKRVYIRSPNEYQFYSELKQVRRDDEISNEIKPEILNLINKAIAIGVGVQDLGKIFLGSLDNDVVKNVVKEFCLSGGTSSVEEDEFEEPNQDRLNHEISPEIKEDVNNLINRAMGMGVTIADLSKIFLESLDKDIVMFVIKGLNEPQILSSLDEISQNSEGRTQDNNEISKNIQEDVANLINRATGLGVTDQDLTKLLLQSFNKNSITPAIMEFCASDSSESITEKSEASTSVEECVTRLIRSSDDLGTDRFRAILAGFPEEKVQGFTQKIVNSLGEERVSKCVTKEVLMRTISDVETDDLLKAAEVLSAQDRNRLCEKFLKFVTHNFPRI